MAGLLAMAGLYGGAVAAGVGSFTGDILDPQSEGGDETKGLIFGPAEGFGTNAIKFVPDTTPRKTDGGGRARFDRIRARGGRVRGARSVRGGGTVTKTVPTSSDDTVKKPEIKDDTEQVSDDGGIRGANGGTAPRVGLNEPTEQKKQTGKTPRYEPQRKTGRLREFKKIPFIIPERVPQTLNHNNVDTTSFANANYNMNASLFL